MKKSFLALLLGLVSSSVLAGGQPRGTLLELHSCELYAGGCVVSSEATLDGRYMLRAWNFTDGLFEGQNLRGLQVALLQASSENLAAEGTASDRAIVYLPEAAEAAQRTALLKWLKTTLPDLTSVELETRVAPLQFTSTQAGYVFQAGKSIVVKTASLESCETGACGESLWYSPRTPSNLYTVVVNQSATVNEPLLQLNWRDGGKRSVFLAKFGSEDSPKNLYVTATDLCGPAETLF